MKKPFRTAYAPNPSSKYDISPILEIADKVEYASRSPVYDASMSNKIDIAKEVELVMSTFTSGNDIIIDSGDPVLLVMMVMYLSDRWSGFHFARYNVRAGRYVTTYVSHSELNQLACGGEEVYDD